MRFLLYAVSIVTCCLLTYLIPGTQQQKQRIAEAQKTLDEQQRDLDLLANRLENQIDFQDHVNKELTRQVKETIVEREKTFTSLTDKIASRQSCDEAKIKSVLYKVLDERAATIPAPKPEALTNITKKVAKIIYSKWADGSCESCEAWAANVAPKLRAAGYEVAIRGHVNDGKEPSPKITIVYNDGKEEDACPEDLDKLLVVKNEAAKDVNAPMTAQIRVNASGTFRTAGSLEEAGRTGAQIVIDPALNCHVCQEVGTDGKPVGPLQIRPRYAKNYLEDTCVTTRTVGGWSSGCTVTYGPASVVVAPPLAVSPEVRRESYFERTIVGPRGGCRIVNGVRICN